VICGLSCLAFDITLGSNDALLVRVASVLIIITFVAAGGDRDSLGPPLRPPLVTSSAPLCTFVSCVGRCPPATARSRLPNVVYKIGPDHFLTRGVTSGDVEEFFSGLELVTTELVHKASTVCARPERCHRRSWGVHDIFRKTPNVFS
jgi:hypothetical protein